jgi:hypothetical protein
MPASKLLVVAMLLPAVAAAQPGSETEKKRQEIERQLRLPRNPPPPAAPPEPAEPAPAPPVVPGQPAPAAPAPTVFVPEIHGLLMASCRNCHQAGGPAAGSRLVFTGTARADWDAARAFIDPQRPRDSLLVTKAAGTMHGGGPVAPAGSRVQRRLLAWIASGGRLEPGAPPPPPPRPLRPRSGGGVPSKAVPPAPVPAPPPVAAPAPSPEAALPPEPTPVAAPRPDFATTVQPVLTVSCRACHNPQGMAAASRLHLTGDPASDLPAVMPFVVAGRPAESLLVTKGAGTMHGGGPIAPPGSDGHRAVVAWITAGAPGVAAAAPTPAIAASPVTPTPAAAPLPPPTGITPPGPASPHAHGPVPGIALPLGLRLDGRFDLNYERRGLGRDTGWSDGRSVLRSYHQFLFLSRGTERDPIGFSVELIALTTWEATFRHRFENLSLLVRGGKLLVPFGNDPLFHQAYGGLIGFDQKILPPVWAQEGVSASVVHRHGAVSLSGDAYVVRGYRLPKADAVLNLQNDFSPNDDIEPGVGGRLGFAGGPFTAFYSFYYNPLGFDRHLVMQAGDVSLWRIHGVPVLDRLVLGVGALRADVSGGGPGLDYYHFGSYWQARVYATHFLYLQYRQGLRTFNNRRGVIVDDTRLDADDASTHTVGIVARWGGLTAGLHYYINLEKANEVDDDFFRATVVYEF